MYVTCVWVIFVQLYVPFVILQLVHTLLVHLQQITISHYPLEEGGIVCSVLRVAVAAPLGTSLIALAVDRFVKR